MRALSTDEARRFQAAITGTRHEALLLFLLGTGCRPSEAFALRWADLDLDRGVARIWRAVERVRTKLSIRETKTERSRRAIRLSAALVTALRAHRAVQAEEILAAGAAYDREADLVFATEQDHLLDSRNVINRHFKPALKRAGLSESIRLYDLRHSHATLLLHQGVNVKVVSGRLGHASAAMTLDRYSHVLAEGQEQAVAALDAILGG